MEKSEVLIKAPVVEPVPVSASQPSLPVATIVISSNVLFAFDKAELKPEAIDLLKKLMADLSSYPNEQITVVGHADSIGMDEYNLELSQRRAHAVLDHLVSQGIQKERLLAVGKGESEPKASNETAFGRQLNRRVEVEMRLMK
jgi:outer membrane protein OmpA-like peptidoglycan-associated protein